MNEDVYGNCRRKTYALIEQKTCFYEDGEVRWGFPMKDGKVIPANEVAARNYENCLKNEKLKGRVETIRRVFTDTFITCSVCGNEFQFIDEFYGSCGCPHCEEKGRLTWYNFSGQKVCPPREQMKLDDF